MPVSLTPLEPWIAHKIGQSGGPLHRETLAAYQLTNLNRTLALAQTRSRFYGRLLGADDIRLARLDGLADLPFTTADELRAAPLDFLCVPQQEVERIVTLPTSGTTGTPKRIFFNARDQELTIDFFHRGMSTMVVPGDRVLILLPGSLPGSVGALLQEGLSRMQVEGIPHGPVRDLRHTLEVIEQQRVTALVGIPIQVLNLVKQAQADRRPTPSTLKTVLLTTDRMPRSAVQKIERTWGCDVYDHYGTTEMGLGGGVDCRERAGYHLREADLLFEIVDPATGRLMPDGEVGEVVFSTLTREAMPLLRYRTGDMGRFLPEPCPCGTTLKRMAHIDRRVSGVITLPGGRTLSQGDFDESLLPVDGLADFKVLFDHGPSGANIVIRVRALEGTAGPDRDEIRRGLDGIPALAAEMDEGRVSVTVSDWEKSGVVNSGTAKRTIEHLRETAV